MNSNGISTAISEMVSDTMVKPICAEPFSAAASGFSPCSRYRAMFSIMTIASSTTKPEAMVKAISDRLLMLNPSRYIAPKVPTSERGTDRLGIRVARRLRRKRNITRTTSATARVNSNSTSETEARMVVVRSVSSETSIDCGSAD